MVRVLVFALALCFSGSALAMYSVSVLCLALNVYHEASIDPYEGRAAVALVTKNRARKSGTSICWEVFRDQQFTWTEDRKKRQALPRGKGWRAALLLAREVLRPGFEDFTGGATEYHLASMTAWWAPYMQYLGTWGSHKFYKKLDAAHAE